MPLYIEPKSNLSLTSARASYLEASQNPAYAFIIMTQHNYKNIQLSIALWLIMLSDICLIAIAPSKISTNNMLSAKMSAMQSKHQNVDYVWK